MRTWVSGLRRPRGAWCEVVLGHPRRQKKLKSLVNPEKVSHLAKGNRFRQVQLTGNTNPGRLPTGRLALLRRRSGTWREQRYFAQCDSLLPSAGLFFSENPLLFFRMNLMQIQTAIPPTNKADSSTSDRLPACTSRSYFSCCALYRKSHVIRTPTIRTQASRGHFSKNPPQARSSFPKHAL